VDQFQVLAYLDWLTNKDMDDGEKTDTVEDEEEDGRTPRKESKDAPQQVKVPAACSFVLAAEPSPFPSTRPKMCSRSAQVFVSRWLDLRTYLLQ
jgi:hypothetical protein